MLTLEKLTEVSNSLISQISEKAKEQHHFYQGAVEGIKLLYQELTKPLDSSDDNKRAPENNQPSDQAAESNSSAE